MSGKVSLILDFTSDNVNPVIRNVEGITISRTIFNDNAIGILVRGVIGKATYVIGVNRNEDVIFGDQIRGNFYYNIVTLNIDSMVSQINIDPFVSTGIPINFSNIRPFIRPGMVLSMSIMLQPYIGLQEVRANTFDFQSIESTGKIQNINVYSNVNGGTNYFDSTLLIPVRLGIMTNLSEETGDYVQVITLKNGVISTVLLLSFITGITYDNNKIIITCYQERRMALLAKITSGGDQTPAILQLRPTYDINVITVELLGTKLSTVSDYEIDISTYISIYD